MRFLRFFQKPAPPTPTAQVALGPTMASLPKKGTGFAVAGARYRQDALARVLRQRGVKIEIGDSPHLGIVEIRWDRNNAHDAYAMGVYLDQWQIGFVPRMHTRALYRLAQEIQPEHSTAHAQVTRCDDGYRVWIWA